MASLCWSCARHLASLLLKSPSSINSRYVTVKYLLQGQIFSRFHIYICAFTLTIILLRGLGSSSDSWAKCHCLDANFLRSELAQGPEAGAFQPSHCEDKAGPPVKGNGNLQPRLGWQNCSLLLENTFLFLFEVWGRLCCYINVILSIAAI